MSGTIFVMEAANLICGDDENASKHLTIQELKLPSLEEAFADHHPGGSRVGFEVAVGIQKLECSFKLGGIDPDLLVQLGIGSRQPLRYTAYGYVINKRTGEEIEGEAIMEGRLGKAEIDAWQRGEMTGIEYMFREMSHYELSLGERALYEFDLYTNTWKVDGVDQNDAMNRTLRIPQTAG